MNDDALRYFHIEAQELTGQLETGLLGYDEHPEWLSELFRFAHTLKGGARVVRRQVIADLAHAMEDVLAHHREAGTRLAKQEVAELLGIVDAVRQELARAPAGASARSAPGENPAASGQLDLETLRVALSEMDALAAGIHEAGALSKALRAELHALGERRLATLADSLEVELDRLARQTNLLRLVDASVAFPELERAAHDAALLTGKEVRFAARGGGVKLDGHVLSPLRGALLHLVRNAVAHGIEAPAIRRERNKAAAGRVEVSVERRGARIAFIVRDDGAGIDAEAVRRAAAERGIASDGSDGLELIFHPGLSTSNGVSDLSGRGVGLDAVRATVRKLKGSVGVRSELGAGATFELLVPVSLSSIRALAVTIGARSVLVPLDVVVSTLRLSPESTALRGDGQVLLHEGNALPLHDIQAVLEPNPRRVEPRVALVLQTSRGLVGLSADALAGTRDIIVRPLPGAVGDSALVSGAAFDGQGDPELVLDPEGLVTAARGNSQIDAAPRKGPRRILVVDDSLTTRMLEQSILESAGYDVDLASSAHEGLEKAMHGSYGLIVTDVEMPGMDGYAFTAETRRRPELRAIPVIMVTSIATEESRRRGADAGVSAYIVKGEFEQDTFLGVVRECLG